MLERPDSEALGPAFSTPASAWFLLKSIHMLRLMSKTSESKIPHISKLM